MKEITPEKMQARHDANQRGIAKVAETFAAETPDVLIMVGDDQDEIIHNDNMPAICVYWGDSVLGKPRDMSAQAPEAARVSAWAYGHEEKRYPVEAGLGRHLIESFIDQDFDVAHSRYLEEGQGIGHAFGFVYNRIMNESAVPTIPIMLNTYFPPNQPTPKRCYELGRALRNAVESWDSNARVGIIASGGLSHFVVDEELDRRALKAMKEHDVDTLSALPRERLNAGTSETRNWIVVSPALRKSWRWICSTTSRATGRRPGPAAPWPSPSGASPRLGRRQSPAAPMLRWRTGVRMDQQEIQRESEGLAELGKRYWAGEAEIVSAFFERPHTKEEHLRWLRLQVYKEMYGSGLLANPGGIILGLVERLWEQHAKLESQVGREEFLHTSLVLHQEFSHYAMFADLLEELSGEKIDFQELPKYQTL